MVLAVFFAGLIVALLGAMCENAYHAGDIKATGLLSLVQCISQGLIAWVVIADKSLPYLIASAMAWSIGSMVGCYWKKLNHET